MNKTLWLRKFCPNEYVDVTYHHAVCNFLLLFFFVLIKIRGKKDWSRKTAFLTKILVIVFLLFVPIPIICPSYMKVYNVQSDYSVLYIFLYLFQSVMPITCLQTLNIINYCRYLCPFMS